MFTQNESLWLQWIDSKSFVVCLQTHHLNITTKASPHYTVVMVTDGRLSNLITKNIPPNNRSRKNNSLCSMRPNCVKKLNYANILMLLCISSSSSWTAWIWRRRYYGPSKNWSLTIGPEYIAQEVLKLNVSTRRGSSVNLSPPSLFCCFIIYYLF